MQVCNGVCTRYKAMVPPKLRSYKYGVFRCSTCEEYITINGISYTGKTFICTCCKQKIRMKPRYKEVITTD